MSDDKAYKDGDVVWVKLGNNWWPAEVTDTHRQPEGLTKHLKRKPYCIVKFFQEDSYEFVKSSKQIFPFQCNKKDEFIKKGYALHEAKNKFMEKFPSDVEIAERRTSTLIINDRPDSIVKAILGQTCISRNISYNDQLQIGNNCNVRRSGDSVTKIINITSNLKTPITSTTAIATLGNSKSPDVIAKPPTVMQSHNTINDNSNIYRCHLCDFTSIRQNVIIFHRKTHSRDNVYSLSVPVAMSKTPPTNLKLQAAVSKANTPSSFTFKSDYNNIGNKKLTTKCFVPQSDTDNDNGSIYMPLLNTKNNQSQSINRSTAAARLPKKKEFACLATSKRPLRSSPNISSNDLSLQETRKNKTVDTELEVIEHSNSYQTLSSAINTTTTTVSKHSPEEIRKRLLADWSDEEKDDDEVSTSKNLLVRSITNDEIKKNKLDEIPFNINDIDVISKSKNSSTITDTSKPQILNRIRNIPKKDRRDIVLKEFNEPTISYSPLSTSTTLPIVNIDSASSNSCSSDSVVVVGVLSDTNSVKTINVEQTSIQGEGTNIKETNMSPVKTTIEGNTDQKSIILNSEKSDALESKETACDGSNAEDIPSTTLSCFDFQEEEEENYNDMLTSMTNFKKKYLSPDKIQSSCIENKSSKAEILTNSTEAKEELDQKDELLSAEIESLLAQTITTVSDVRMLEGNTNTKDNVFVKGLPIKERGKRIFKSRNRSGLDEVSFSTNILNTEINDNKSINSNELCLTELEEKATEISLIFENPEEKFVKIKQLEIERAKNADIELFKNKSEKCIVKNTEIIQLEQKKAMVEASSTNSEDIKLIDKTSDIGFKNEILEQNLDDTDCKISANSANIQTTEFSSLTDEYSLASIPEANIEFGLPTIVVGDKSFSLHKYNIKSDVNVNIVDMNKTDRQEELKYEKSTQNDDKIIEASRISNVLKKINKSFNNDVKAEIFNDALRKSKTKTPKYVSEGKESEISGEKWIGDEMPQDLLEDEDEDDIESPPHEALSGNELEAELVKVRKSKNANTHIKTSPMKNKNNKNDYDLAKSSNTETKTKKLFTTGSNECEIALNTKTINDLEEERGIIIKNVLHDISTQNSPRESENNSPLIKCNETDLNESEQLKNAVCSRNKNEFSSDENFTIKRIKSKRRHPVDDTNSKHIVNINRKTRKLSELSCSQESLAMNEEHSRHDGKIIIKDNKEVNIASTDEIQCVKDLKEESVHKQIMSTEDLESKRNILLFENSVDSENCKIKPSSLAKISSSLKNQLVDEEKEQINITHNLPVILEDITLQEVEHFESSPTITYSNASKNDPFKISKNIEKIYHDSDHKTNSEENEHNPQNICGISPLEKVRIDVDVSNPLSSQIANILSCNNNSNQIAADTANKNNLNPKLIISKRKNSFEDEIPSFVIERPGNQALTESIEKDAVKHVQNMCPQLKITRKEKILIEPLATSSSKNLDSTIFDINNMPILLSNEQILHSSEVDASIVLSLTSDKSFTQCQSATIKSVTETLPETPRIIKQQILQPARTPSPFLAQHKASGNSNLTNISEECSHQKQIQEQQDIYQQQKMSQQHLNSRYLLIKASTDSIPAATTANIILSSPPQTSQVIKPKSPAAAATGGRKQAGNTISLPNSISAKQQLLKFNDELDTNLDLETHENMKLNKNHQYSSNANNNKRRTQQYIQSQINSQEEIAVSTAKIAKSSRSDGICGTNLTVAQKQLSQLQQQLQQRQKTQESSKQFHHLHNRKPKKQPQQHRNLQKKSETMVLRENAEPQSSEYNQHNLGTSTEHNSQRHVTGQQSVQPTTLNEEQLNQTQQSEDPIDSTSKILAVPTQPIPGYNETFLLCTLVNNNYKPIDNVPLYLDHDLNQLVPVPIDALDREPSLIVNHPPLEDQVTLIQDATEDQQQIVSTNTLKTAEADSSTHLICLDSGTDLVGNSVARVLQTPLTDEVVERDIVATSPMSVFLPNDNASEVIADNAVILNIEGQQIILDAATFTHLLANPDANTQLITDDGTEFILTREVLAALEAQQAEQQIQQLQIAGQQIPSASNTTDILAVALAGSDLYNSEVLEIETSQRLQLMGSDVFQPSVLPQPHLTPPITAHTSETSTLLNQTPIMSPLEKPSTSLNKAKHLDFVGHIGTNTGVPISSELVDCRPNLEDSLAVIGVTPQSAVPSSLELPITVTDPKIASKVTMQTTPADIVQYQTHCADNILNNDSRLYNDSNS
ncbi:uncharacterized protein LOC119665736 [Teleopsis dalmanni]|uniref:uncharacterized protein LOC119665736 n=1 Tax=Teleopsis dalmanni TaxID=139649 RepID=UPI0018CF5CF3|nr:uncharacterized protein LOC119665736 [Teleopsis dalmanni]